MLHWIASNTIVACGFAVLAAVVSLTLKRRPAVGHLLWLCVLIALVAPPLPKLALLDGRAHARRLATQVGQSFASVDWLQMRMGIAPPTGDDVSMAHGAPRPSGEHTAAHPADPTVHAETCETCRALAAALGRPVAPASDAGFSYASEFSVDAPAPVALEPVWSQTGPAVLGKEVKSAKAGPVEPGTAWTEDAGPSDKERAASMSPPPGWKLRPAPTDWSGLFASLAVVVWLSGAGVAIARLLLGWRRLQGLIRRAGPAGDAFVAEVCSTAREMGVRPPLVRVSGAVRTPFIVGGSRPALLWPRGESLDAAGARAVLAHEMAHLARRDHWSAWFEAVVLCLLWWHPLAHLARTQTRAHAERACDAWVVWAYPEARRDYADALLAAVERLTRLPRPVPALAAVDSDKRTLARRLVMIMQGNIARRGSRLLAIGAITLTAALAPSWATTRLDPFGATIGYLSIDRSLQPLVDSAKLERLARSHADAEEYDQAIAAYQELLRARPEDAGAFHELAMAQYHAGRYADAARTFAAGAEVAGAQDQSWWQVGGISVGKATDAARKAALAGEKAKVAAEKGRLAAERAEVAAAERAAHGAEQVARAQEQAAQAKARVAEARAQLELVQAQLAESGIEVDLRDELADLDSEIDEAVADAMDQVAELSDQDWEQFGEAFEDMGDWGDDFDFDFDFGGMTPLADWAYNEACCHALAGDEGAALEALSRAIALGYADADHAADDGDLASVRQTDAFKECRSQMLELTELLEFAEEAMAQERWAGAAGAYAKASQIAPRSGYLAHMHAFAALRDGDTGAAVEGWSRAMELGYNKPTMLYNLACANAQAGQDDEAVAYLAKAVKAGFDNYQLMREDADLDPVRGEPRFDEILSGVIEDAKLQREIETAVEFEEWSEVVRMAETLRDRSPEHSWRRSWAQEKLALAYFYDARYDEAEDAFAASALGGGDLTRSLYNIACCRSLSGDEAGALDYLHASIDAGWDDAEHLQHDEDLAAVRDDPGFEKVLARAADSQILQQFGAADWDELLDRSERQIEADPEDGAAHLRLGWALLRTGHPDKAIPVFRRQAELGFAPGIGLYNIACCNAVMGEKDAAIAAIKEAIEAGFDRPEFMAEDPDLKNLRDDPRFKKLTSGGANAKVSKF